MGVSGDAPYHYCIFAYTLKNTHTHTQQIQMSIFKHIIQKTVIKTIKIKYLEFSKYIIPENILNHFYWYTQIALKLDEIGYLGVLNGHIL